MMTLHQEHLYIPYFDCDGDGRKVGYVISYSKKECRDRFAAVMNTAWKDLYKRGWRIVLCEVIADERDVYPNDPQYQM